MGYEGQAAWITGGGTGIGRALALELARQGADVAVSGRRLDKLEAVAREVEALGRRGLALACDVRSEAEVEATADRVAAAFGRMDVAIANAGYAVGGPVEALSAERLRNQLDVNVVGAVMTAKHALTHLRPAKGRLGLVGSVAAFTPLAKNGAYCASKAALRAIGQSLAIELAGTGASVTILHPGFIESEINQVDDDGVHHPDREDKRPKQLMWPADRAARVMLKALYARKTEHVFTGHGKLGAALGQHLPGLMVFAQSQQRKRKRR
ncbi:MAG: SDR family NAD(P)-dependent oxidoreductase [Sandaracinaceae bacterium]|nr:SDR family NAD(P)-dependent oxidoreductase [Sandaracinaceae bacterium]